MHERPCDPSPGAPPRRPVLQRRAPWPAATTQADEEHRGGDPGVDASARKIPPMVSHTDHRPTQLISRSTPRRSAELGEHEGDHLASGEHRQRPARQQLELPADHDPGEDREAVDDRVEQRAHAAVLAGDAGQEAVEVVACRDRQEEDRRRPPSGRRRSAAPGRGTRGFPPAARSRPGSGPSGAAAAGRAASPSASGPERSRPKRRCLRRGHRAARARGRPPRRPADAPRHRVRRTCASTAPSASASPADHDPQRTPEQLGVGELLARPGVAVVVHDRDAGLPQLLVQARPPPRATSSPPLPSPTRWTSHGAIERGQTIPRSSAPCSIAAATIRAGPIP